LTRLVLDLKVQVVLIAGNHDSPDRLGFASRVLQEKGLHIQGRLEPRPAEIALHDEHGPVVIYALPYAEPSLVRERLEDPTLQTHDGAMKALVQRIRMKKPKQRRSVLVTHAFVRGGRESESERPLSVGGAGTVETACFDGFAYTALGHLHQAQRMGNESIQYSGSLMKYSFSELSHRKSVNLVEMDGAGRCRTERMPLEPARDLRCIEGTLDAVLAGSEEDHRREDFLRINLLDKEPVLDALGKLRSVYPNVLHIERPHLTPGSGPDPLSGDHRLMSDEELFAGFFHQVTGERLQEKQAEAYRSVLDALGRLEREVTP
jgi:exonuclease SbcD